MVARVLLVWLMVGGVGKVADRKTAADGVTRGWLVESPSPDQSEVSQRWRTVAGTLVIARHGRVVRRISAEQTFWRWAFWDGGKEVAYEVGPMHGATECRLVAVKTGREVATMPGDCADVSADAPAWVVELMKH